MSLRHLMPLLIIAIATPGFAAKGYHLWYDENGQAVYSQFAPGGETESRIIAPPPPPAEPPEVAQRRLLDRRQQLEDNREDRQLEAERTAQIDDEQARLKQRCDGARQNLTLLNGPARRLFQTADGIRRLTEEERQAKRDEMQKIIDEECQ